MTERPILFSAPMVRALLAGTKTQTRRAVKFKPWHQIEERDDGTPWPWMQSDDNDAGVWLRCPYGAPGDRLWVRETWNTFEGWAGYFYAADDHSFGIGADDDPDHIPEHAVRWRPSIHMPRAASRITLEITGVRVERLLDISQKDCIAEGIESVDAGVWRDYGFPEPCVDGFATPRKSYLSLWEQINGPGSWDANPWVWVLTFRRLL